MEMEIRHFHRRNLPHLYYNEGKYFITYRLAGTIPLKVLTTMRAEIDYKIENDQRLSFSEKKFFKKYDEYLDNAASGHDYLRQDKFSEIIKSTLHYADEKDYSLLCYTVMPNHVHLVFELLDKNKGISKIMQSIKRISARDCNKLLGSEGSFWCEESFDRLIRDDVELYYVINYVINNPVKAGLIKDWKDWKHTYLSEKYSYLG